MTHIHQGLKLNWLARHFGPNTTVIGNRPYINALLTEVERLNRRIEALEGKSDTPTVAAIKRLGTQGKGSE